MTHGRIIIDGRSRGAGFSVSKDKIITAAHVIGNAGASTIRFVFTDANSGRQAERSVEIEAVEVDDYLDIAVLQPSTEVPCAFRFRRGRDGEGWRVNTRSLGNDPVLEGHITVADHEILNSADNPISVLQLNSYGYLGDYVGYSGGAVSLAAAPNVVVGMLIEQVHLRIAAISSRRFASNVLYALPIEKILGRIGLAGKVETVVLPLARTFNLDRTKAVGLWNIPAPVVGFSHRSEELARVSDHFSSDTAPPLFIYGFPGVGKSQIAQAFAWSRRSDATAGWWIDCATSLSLTSGLEQLAQKLGLSNREIRAGDVSHLIAENVELSRDWLIILDDLRDCAILPDVIVNSSAMVIVTCREISGLARDAFEISCFDATIGAQYLLERTGDDDFLSASRLSAAVGNLPLALEQVASYCRATACGLRGFLERYIRDPQRMLSQDAPSSHLEDVATVWRQSVELLESEQAAARKILDSMAFLSSTVLPVEVLSFATRAQEQVGSGEDAEITDSLIEFDMNIRALRKLSLISIEPPAGVKIHATTQQLTLQAILRDAEAEHQSAMTRPSAESMKGSTLAFSAAAAGLNDSFPHNGDMPASWNRCAVLLPHAEALLEHSVTSGKGAIIAADFYSSVVRYLRSISQYRQAERFARAAFEIRKDLMGINSRLALTSGSDLANLLSDLGDRNEALDLHSVVFGARVREFGETDSDSIASMLNLSLLHYELGNLAEAERLARKGLEIELARDQDRRRIIAFTNNLCGILRDMGNIEEAASLMGDVVAYRNSQLGESHPDSIAAACNYATLLSAIGNLGAAEDLMTAVVSTAQSSLGEEHHYTLMARNIFVDVVLESGRADVAAAEYAALYPKMAEVLGQDNLDTLLLLASLAKANCYLNKYAQAIDQFTSALTGLSLVLPEDHPDVLQVLLAAAYCFQRAGETKQAEAAARQVISKSSRSLGQDNELRRQAEELLENQ